MTTPQKLRCSPPGPDITFSLRKPSSDTQPVNEKRKLPHHPKRSSYVPLCVAAYTPAKLKNFNLIPFQDLSYAGKPALDIIT